VDELAIKGGRPASPYIIHLARPVFTEAETAEITRVLKTGNLRQGDVTREFEERFAERMGAVHTYAVSSGTAALHLSYLSLLEEGDEVIVPAFSFIATASLIHHAKARPVFADIDPYTFLVDPEDVKEKVTPSTRALAPVHLFGGSCDMKALQDLAEDHDLFIVNDCAQAHGTTHDGRELGSYETVGCYSFYPSKSMTTGEGGMVTTNTARLHELGVLLRNHGENSKHDHVAWGYNYRTTDIAAALGLIQLKKLDEGLAKRRSAAEKLRRGLEGMEAVTPQKFLAPSKPSYSYFTVRLELEELKCTRDRFAEALRAENIECGIHYPRALTQQPIVIETYNPQGCKVAEGLSKRVISLPMHPGLTDEDVSYILEGVEKVLTCFIR
jgi:perosamine synthetase